MYELIADVETKIKIIQNYGKFLLILNDLVGYESVIIILTLLEIVVFNFWNIYIVICMALFSDTNIITFRPVIQHIVDSEPLALKREYTILTYGLGITYLRDVMDSLLIHFVRTLLKISMYFTIWILSNMHKRFFRN